MAKAKKQKTAYTLIATCEADSAHRGAIPKSIDPLLEIPTLKTKNLYYAATKGQVDQCLAVGDTKGAWLAIEKYLGIVKDTSSFPCPMNVFPVDTQLNAPYHGAHKVFGSIRDAARWIFPQYFASTVKDKKNPGKAHFRKSVQVRPNHIFFYRPNLRANRITKPDGIQGQQPTPDVSGFAKYEFVDMPFHFQYYLNINPRGKFEPLLSDINKMKEVIYQAANHGLGACRSAGFGMLRVLDIVLKDGDVRPRGFELHGLKAA